MKKLLLACLLLLTGCSAPLRKDGPWSAFWNNDSTLLGFKDPRGRTRIEPKFSGFTTARKFEAIVAVMEQKNGEPEAYYLTKSGKIVGRDSVYLVDNGPDCESEGFIRFRDHQRDKAGMYDHRGETAIPAEYDDLTNVRNGLVAALKGAEKKAWDEKEPSGCVHFTWQGGKEVLLDTKNTLLIDHFTYDPGLDFYSLKITEEPLQDPVRRSFPGADGRTYSFIDYQKEFQGWLHAAILAPISQEKLIAASYPKIYVWREPDGWRPEDGRSWIENNFECIRRSLSELTKDNAEVILSLGGLNPFIYRGAEFERYFNHCGEPKEWQYPVMSVIVNRQAGGKASQDSFDFLRTEEGYRLISITLGSDTLK